MIDLKSAKPDKYTLTDVTPVDNALNDAILRSKQKLILCSGAIVFSIVLSMSAFLVLQQHLGYLLLINICLLVHAWLCQAKLAPLIKLFMLQSLVTIGLYVLLYGQERLFEAVIVVTRIILVMLPSWWLASTQSSHQISQVLSLLLPTKWAFVVTTSIKVLPFIGQEARDIYHIQCLRGARITPKALMNPINWFELVKCVLFPLLIQLLSLSKHIAHSANQRHFDKSSTHTHWPLN
ncbi:MULTISPECIES: energy-coupling factor transporter transmembrane component T [Shewanella]|uniref:Energy-coupling factor transporter transmembrane component T n=1 Tax=Shewanella metallivivens TaxID=2872342 RepID=A0ABT5TGQ5_9GAMM|nr:energy-coupling factor transporter transmembrane component T [Shewanella metallivivens]MDD8057793.1 energy-coupling factor transporter transmembrane component T [Shewanella metallivivens]